MAGDPSQLGSLYASGRIPKLEPSETQRSQWMGPNARPSALVHRKLYLFNFCLISFSLQNCIFVFQISANSVFSSVNLVFEQKNVVH